MRPSKELRIGTHMHPLLNNQVSRAVDMHAHTHCNVRPNSYTPDANVALRWY